MTSSQTVFHSGYVALVGKPNVGKSTLLNSLIGEKVSIIAPKPQTTRWQVLGIDTTSNAQVVYIDTPGINERNKRAMNRYLNRVAQSVLHDANLILFIIDITHFDSTDQLILDQLKETGKPVILVMNKIDLIADKSLLLPLLNEYQERFQFAGLVPIAAKSHSNIETLKDVIVKHLPEGELIYPEDQLTDKTDRFLVAEIIREKLILATEEELPYSTAVEIEQFVVGERMTEISAVIWVERPGQKAIVIGKQGAKLKHIGTRARYDIEALLERKVFLRLWVKIKSDWTDDDRALRGLGYE